MEPNVIKEKSIKEMADVSIRYLLNKAIKDSEVNTSLISDGHHTFGELYDHRIALFIALCLSIMKNNGHKHEYNVWRSWRHSDGSETPGWFILGIGKEKGEQITYHLPESAWEECGLIPILTFAPVFDGHSSEDVLERIRKL